MVKIHKYWLTNEYCPSCGLQISSLFVNIHCGCGWIGKSKQLLNLKNLRKLKLNKINDTLD